MSTEVNPIGRVNKIKINFIGRSFGRLTVLSIHERVIGKHIKYKCVCQCGKESIATGTNLLTGTTKSCGCLKRESTIANRTKDFSKVIFPEGNHLGAGISEAEYLSIHAWIRHHHGKPNKCEICGSCENKRYEWALRKGFKYDRDIKSYIRLCKGCHSVYDFTEETRIKLSKSHKGKVLTYLHKAIIQYDEKMNKISEYESIAKASKITGIIRTSISNNLSGRYKKSGGFIWKYKNQ